MARRSDQQKMKDNYEIAQDIKAVSNQWAKVHNKTISAFAEEMLNGMNRFQFSRYRSGKRLPDPEIRRIIAGIGRELGISTPALSEYELRDVNNFETDWKGKGSLTDFFKAHVGQEDNEEAEPISETFFSFIRSEFDVSEDFHPFYKTRNEINKKSKEDSVLAYNSRFSGHDEFNVDPYYYSIPRGSKYWYPDGNKFRLTSLKDKDDLFVIQEKAKEYIGYLFYLKRKDDLALVDFFVKINQFEALKEEDSSVLYDDPFPELEQCISNAKVNYPLPPNWRDIYRRLSKYLEERNGKEQEVLDNGEHNEKGI